MIKILFLAAGPRDTPSLELQAEADAIRARLRAARYGEHFEFVVEPRTYVADLQELLEKHQPHIVHFSGHGADDGGGEVFMLDRNDYAYAVAPEALADTFRLFKSRLRLVVVSACYSEPQARAIAAHIPAVVGMATRVSHDAAIAFAASFYQALAQGANVAAAFEHGRTQLLHEFPNEIDAPRIVAGRVNLASVCFAIQVIPDEVVKPPATLSREHLLYLRDLFGKPWASVRMADLLADRDDEARLLDVYVPLRVDFMVYFKTQAGRINDWWVEQDESKMEHIREISGIGQTACAKNRIADQPPKNRVWSNLGVGEASLQHIVDGIQRKLARPHDSEDKETQNGEHSYFMEAQDAASVQPRMVLLGAPGSGKTSFLRHLALCMAGELRRRSGDSDVPEKANITSALNDDWLLDAFTPVYIELRDLVNRTFPSLPIAPDQDAQPPTADDFWRYVTEHGVPTVARAFAADLPQLFHDGAAILLLDGLDEVPQAADPARRRQKQIKSLIGQLTEAYPRLRVIITGRLHAYQPEDKMLPGFGRTELKPLDFGRLRQLAHALFHAIQLPDADNRAEAFTDALAQAVNSRKIKADMHATPLFFTMLAGLWLSHPGRGFPDTESELYRESVDLLLGRYTQRRLPDLSVADNLGIPREHLRPVLESLACTIQEQSLPGQDTTEFHVRELLGVLAVGGFNARIVDVSEYLEQRAGILASHRPHYYYFLHRSFQEHLAACELTCEHPDTRKPAVDADRRFPEGLLRRAQTAPELWENVVQLAGDELAARRGPDFARLLVDLARPYLAEAQSRNTALPALHLAFQHKLLSCSIDPYHAFGSARACIRDVSARILVDPSFTPEQRDIAGQLLGDGTRDNAGNLTWPPPGHDTRPGVGLRADGLPDIVWQPVPDDGEFTYQEAERRREPNFWIARYPVTYAQYRAFLEAGEWRNDRWWLEPQPLSPPKGHRSAPGQQQFQYWNHPAERVSWYDAVAYTRWLTDLANRVPDRLGLPPPGAGNKWSIRLPTEWQWEKAARGADGRIYPWDDKYQSGLANINESYDKLGPHYLQKTSAVGMYPHGQSPYKIMDMSGNVWEWCLNEHDNPENFLETGSVDRVLRGGSWSIYAERASALDRYRFWYYGRYGYYGFRVVAVVVPSASER